MILIRLTLLIPNLIIINKQLVVLYEMNVCVFQVISMQKVRHYEGRADTETVRPASGHQSGNPYYLYSMLLYTIQ